MLVGVNIGVMGEGRGEYSELVVVISSRITSVS